MVFPIMLIGCKKEKSSLPDIIGTWELMDIKTKSAHIGEEQVQISATFNADNTFSVSQMIGQGRPVTYKGTWQLKGSTLSGKYSDGKPWGATYHITVDGRVLTMTPVIQGAETYIYQKK